MSDGAARENFGFTATGEKVERVTISKGGLTAKVITWGAVIQDLRLDGHQPPLVLGFDKFEDYKYSSYFGATPGRNANRIGNGRFSIDGHEYQLELNEKGVTHLHGGSDGMGKRNWMLMEHGESHAVLQIIDPDGRAGYPGNCTVTATYTIRDGGVLSVVYETVSDKPTIANVCQHSYFNLDGAETALGHEISIAADYYLPTNEQQIPTGEIRSVDGTVFDLRQPTPMRRKENGEQVLYDHNFCLSPERRAKRKIARAYSPASDIALEVHTTEPGVQFYSAFKLNVPVPGLDGRHYGPFAGFCLETQIWPDAVNHADFPHAILRPGETLRQETDYIFTKG
ncbi:MULTISPECIES: aldose epimerase family protein [Agrobacterium]|uniref:aldose epimerase family protein n=1 Tax=Agrobacterium TaxID=357 RepID=UPI000B106ECB|nr:MULTISPECIES: aldose epimerase family protein [Agrobacterium]MBO0127508.1 galactose mutarotase [Agrobacterium sp. OT33]NSX91858.1 galactose mutarotase [Agrobacterium tumefaciens]